MNSKTLMTYGAIALGLFAVWYVWPRHATALSTQPGQQQRDQELADWHTLVSESQAAHDAAVARENEQALAGLGVGLPSFGGM